MHGRTSPVQACHRPCAAALVGGLWIRAMQSRNSNCGALTVWSGASCRVQRHRPRHALAGADSDSPPTRSRACPVAGRLRRQSRDAGSPVGVRDRVGEAPSRGRRSFGRLEDEVKAPRTNEQREAWAGGTAVGMMTTGPAGRYMGIEDGPMIFPVPGNVLLARRPPSRIESTVTNVIHGAAY